MKDKDENEDSYAHKFMIAIRKEGTEETATGIVKPDSEKIMKKWESRVKLMTKVEKSIYMLMTDISMLEVQPEKMIIHPAEHIIRRYISIIETEKKMRSGIDLGALKREVDTKILTLKKVH